MHMNRDAILENVRRYRAIASLYRQTAAFRPLQKWSLLDQAEEWEHRAVVELEAYFEARDNVAYLPSQPARRVDARWDMVAAA
jgi:uncharacterized protein YijF (DUF1287 family)